MRRLGYPRSCYLWWSRAVGCESDTTAVRRHVRRSRGCIQGCLWPGGPRCCRRGRQKMPAPQPSAPSLATVGRPGSRSPRRRRDPAHRAAASVPRFLRPVLPDAGYASRLPTDLGVASARQGPVVERAGERAPSCTFYPRCGCTCGLRRWTGDSVRFLCVAGCSELPDQVSPVWGWSVMVHRNRVVTHRPRVERWRAVPGALVAHLVDGEDAVFRFTAALDATSARMRRKPRRRRRPG